MPKGLYTRNGIYWARFKIKGVEYRRSLFTRSESRAQKLLEQERERIIDEVYFGGREKVSWKQAVVSWSEQGSKAAGIKPSTFNRYLTSLGQLDPWLGDKMLHEIDNRLLKQIVIARQRHDTSNATIRRDLTAVSSVLAHAVDQDWIEENAARTIDRSRFKEPRAKIILPRPHSLQRMFSDPSRFMDMARFSLQTGMREEEVAGLTHDAINRKRGSVTLENTKSGRVREVTLTAEALEIIDRQPRHIRGAYVFWHGNGLRFSSVAEQWRNKIAGAARKAAQSDDNFTPFRFHDLRHLFAVTFLRSQRGSLYDLQQELGHASIATTERYLDHLTPDEKRWAKQAVAQFASQMQRFEAEK